MIHGDLDMSDEYVQVVTTTGSRDEAQSLARLAVERRLAACAQITAPIRSIYRWQDAVQEADEWMVIMKTTSARLEDLMRQIRAEHS
jgi:periplasmic divalent cation tolerance protein